MDSNVTFQWPRRVEWRLSLLLISGQVAGQARWRTAPAQDSSRLFIPPQIGKRPPSTSLHLLNSTLPPSHPVRQKICLLEDDRVCLHLVCHHTYIKPCRHALGLPRSPSTHIRVAHIRHTNAIQVVEARRPHWDQRALQERSRFAVIMLATKMYQSPSECTAHTRVGTVCGRRIGIAAQLSFFVRFRSLHPLRSHLLSALMKADM